MNEILRIFDDNDQDIPEELPPRLAGFLRDSSRLPVRADGDRIAGAYDFFQDDGIQRPHQPSRRMAETFQFVLYLMARDPLGPDGRLVRATVREQIRREGGWDHERHGAPLNQEQLLGALLLFSVADEALALWDDTLRHRIWGPSEEGVALTRAFIAHEQQGLPAVVYGLIPALIRKVTDRQAADWMEVPTSRWRLAVSGAVGVSRVLENAEDRFPRAERFLDRAGQKLVAGQARAVLRGREQEFDLPQSLRDAWPRP